MKCADCDALVKPYRCRKCRLKHDPMTRERLMKIFDAGDGVSDGVNTFFKSASSGMIFGSCSSGQECCSFEYFNVDEFLRSHALNCLEAL